MLGNTKYSHTISFSILSHFKDVLNQLIQSVNHAFVLLD